MNLWFKPFILITLELDYIPIKVVMKSENFFAVLFFAIVATFGSVIVRRQAPATYELPSGAELILSAPVNPSFTCQGRGYGYYADISNNCQIFHVCVPDVLADGQLQTRTYSFLCGNQTIFDQSQLTCNHPQDAGVPCDQSELFYSKNEDFGKTDRPQGRN